MTDSDQCIMRLVTSRCWDKNQTGARCGIVLREVRGYMHRHKSGVLRPGNATRTFCHNCSQNVALWRSGAVLRQLAFVLSSRWLRRLCFLAQ